MTKERNALKAGLFIVVATVLVVIVVIAVKGGVRFAEGRTTYTASFRLTDDIGGLGIGDDVRVGGWKVGTVQSIDAVDLDKDARLLVSFTLPSRFQLRQNATLRVQSTLTGSTALNVESMGSGELIAPEKPFAGKPDPKTVLFASLGGAAENISAATDDLRATMADVRKTVVPQVSATLDSFKGTGDSATALVKDVHGRVPEIFDRYGKVTDSTVAMMQSITDMIGPSTTDWKGLLANLNQASGTINQKLPGMLAKVESSLDSAQGALADIRATAANTKELSESIRNVIGRNEGRLDNIIAGLKTTSDNLKATSAEVRHSPWRLLYKPGPGEVQNLTTYDTARQFAEGAGQINDAATALRDALKTGQAKPEDVQQLLAQLEKSFGRFREVEGKLWQEVKR
jgi:ABC-type transporter Mla subunit MlaD